MAAPGIRQIVSVPELRGITVAAAIGLGGLGLMTVAFPLFAVEHLGGERSDAGYMWAAFAAGSTLGALSLVRLQRRLPPERIVLAGYAIFGVLMLTWPLAGSCALLLALIALAGMADGPALAAQFAVRQQVVPPSLYGQVFTTAAGLKVGSFAMGAGLAGPVVTGLGSAEAMLVAAGAQVAGRGGRRHADAAPGAGAASGVAGRLRLGLLAARRSCSPSCGLYGSNSGGGSGSVGVIAAGRRRPARAGRRGRRRAGLGRQVVRRPLGALAQRRPAPGSPRRRAPAGSGRAAGRTGAPRSAAAAQAPAAAITVPSPNGQMEALAERPRAQQREHRQRHEDLGDLDERERAEGADREQHGADGRRLLLEAQEAEGADRAQPSSSGRRPPKPVSGSCQKPISSSPSSQQR